MFALGVNCLFALHTWIDLQYTLPDQIKAKVMEFFILLSVCCAVEAQAHENVAKNIQDVNYYVDT